MAPSLYEEALGPGFGRLQPELQEYFAGPGSGRFGTGTGVFAVAGCPRAWLRPLLPLLPVRNAFFGSYGEQVPFTIENYPHTDPFGRPALTAVRSFAFPGGTRVFEDTTTLTGAGVLTDYLGRDRNLATDLVLEVTREGHLRMLSPNSRLFLGPLRLPLPAFAAADADVRQWWDPERSAFGISARVRQRQVGTVFVYEGTFSYRTRDFDGVLPPAVQPRRWERRT